MKKDSGPPLICVVDQNKQSSQVMSRLTKMKGKEGASSRPRTREKSTESSGEAKKEAAAPAKPVGLQW